MTALALLPSSMRTYSFLLAGLVTVLAGPFLAYATFSDITPTSPYANATEFLQQTGVIQGYSDGTFRPDQAVNRAEFLKMLMEAQGEHMTETDSTKNCFTDVRDEWFASYICAAHKQGWVQGYTDGSFKPAQTVNKVEALKMLLEVHGYQDELTVVDTKYLFSDTRAGEWFAPYVSLANRLGILEEEGDKFAPAEDMRRGSIAEIIFRESIRAVHNAERYEETLAQNYFAVQGYTYTTGSGTVLTQETGSGSILNDTDTATTETPDEIKNNNEETTPTEEVTTNTQSKIHYMGLPPVDKISLRSGTTIAFRLRPSGTGQESFAFLNTDTEQPLTWESLSQALPNLRLDFESMTQVVELLEFQKRIGDLGRYARIELLGGSMDETGGMIIDVRAEDQCYESITTRYFFKNNVGLTDTHILDTTPALAICA